MNTSPDSQINSDESELPQTLFDAVYNDVDSALSASMQYVAGYFQEELSENELNALKLTYADPWMDFSGYAGFDGEGNLLEVRMTTPTQVPDTEITVAMSQVLAVLDYIFSDGEAVSVTENTEAVMYRWERSENEIILEVDSVIDGVNVSFTATSTSENESAVKKVLETLVYVYASEFDSERLSEVTAEYIPEYKDEDLSLSEAYADGDFGAYLPKKLPDGFSEESIRRYKDYQNDYLSGLWTSGLAQIEWRVYYMSEEDENRLTSVETVENYDLSLYPIPMAQSVPEELREIVSHPIFDINELTLDAVYARSRFTEELGDASGCRTSFDVCFGDVVVRISTKGVSPEWIFDALTSLK